MTRCRALLSLLLCLALPLQGLAAVMLPAPCPMAAMAAEAGQAAELAHAHGALAAMHSLARADCCNDPAEQGQSGKLCKMGKDCLAAPAMALPPIGPMLERIATSAPVLALAAGPGKMRLASIWRPPSAFL